MPAMEMMQPGIGRTAFLDNLKKSQLLPTRQLEKLHSLIEGLQTGTEIADRLVGQQLLTRFQAARLLAGRSEGLVVGQYVIQDYLGRGAVGRVYKARHRAMERAVCVHVLASEHTRLPASRLALQNEARAAAQLVNSHIVTILDVNEVGERMYLVTEYVDGASCDKLIAQTGAMAAKPAAEIIRQTALGLQFAHERNVYHGRLSADAILVGHAGASTHGKPVVKISGFGLSQVPDAPSELLVVSATRAPEQFPNPLLRDPRADVYALGCILYALLAGRYPFEAAHPEELARLHRSAEPPRLSSIRPDAPALLVKLLSRMLAKSPAERPSAAEAAFVIESYLTQEESGLIDYSAAQSTANAGSGPLSFVGHQLSGLIPAATVTPLPDQAIVDQDVEVLSESQLDTQPARDLNEATPLNSPAIRKPTQRQRRRDSGIHPITMLLLMAAVVLMTFIALWRILLLFRA